MYHPVGIHGVGADNRKWVKTNEQGRIVARIVEKDHEFKASRLVFDGEGVGNSHYLGSYYSLDQAKAAIDAPAQE